MNDQLDQVLAYSQLIKAQEIELLAAIQTKVVNALARFEDQRQYAHADQIAAVNTLDALRNHRLHPKQGLCLRGPVTAGASAVVDTCKDHHRCLVQGIAFGGLVQR
ncbi:hypothetical protein D3C79_874920 [compost metagenome]